MLNNSTNSSSKTLPLLIFIGGVNSKGLEDRWQIDNIEFSGEIRQVSWASGFRYPECFLDALNPAKIAQTAESYLDVMQSADREGARLAEELLSEVLPPRRVFVIAHSMGTRVAASLFRHIGNSKRECPIHQLFLFNGAAPIHPDWNLREIALINAVGGVHNFFNPLDPVIGPLAVFCRAVQWMSLVDLLPQIGGKPNRYCFEPPIGHFPTTTVSYNYEISPWQKVSHEIGDLGQYLKFNSNYKEFIVSPEAMRGVPSTLGEFMNEVFDSLFVDPFKNPRDYLSSLTSEKREAVKTMCAGIGGAQSLIDSTLLLMKTFRTNTASLKKLDALEKDYENALHGGTRTLPLPSGKHSGSLH